MIKIPVTYEDFNGNERTEDFYFHMSKAELIELQFSKQGGLGAYLEDLVKAENQGELIGVFKELLLASYGVKSEDGRRFIKNDEIREAFQQCPAYSDLYMRFATDDKEAANFVNGLMPADLVKQMAAEASGASAQSLIASAT